MPGTSLQKLLPQCTPECTLFYRRKPGSEVILISGLWMIQVRKVLEKEYFDLGDAKYKWGDAKIAGQKSSKNLKCGHLL